jgi:ribose transport system substrate-binding protein
MEGNKMNKNVGSPYAGTGTVDFRKMKQIDDICRDHLLGRLDRRDLIRAAIKLGIGAAALGTALGTLGLANGAFADVDQAQQIIAQLGLSYAATHDSPDPKTMTVVPAGKYQKAGPWTIGFSNSFSNNSWRTNMLWCLKYFCSKNKDKLRALYYTDANQSLPQQISDVQSMRDRGVDALLIEPGGIGDSLKAAIMRINAQGVPIVPFDGVLQEGVPYTTWIGMNLRYIGVASAAFLINQLQNKGNILICRGLAGAINDNLWWNDAETVLTKSGLKIVGQVYTDWDFAKSKQNVAEFLASHPGEIHGVWNENGAAAMGAMEAFEEAGRPVPPTMGDQNNGFLKKWATLAAKSGYVAHGYIYPTWLSSDGLQIIFNLLEGQSAPHDDYRPLGIVTNENLATYVRPDLPDSYFSVNYLPNDWIKRMYSERISFDDIHA